LSTTPEEEGWPYLTADLPGCGGELRSVPEDFEVEELPAYPPGGEGEHLFLWVEKRGRDTPSVARALAGALGLTPREVSYAGLKDRHALTRQLFCVPARVEAKLASFSAPGVSVLWTRRHANKLRTGHLKGNRFRIRIRGVSDPQAARAAFERIERQGLPNFFGEQRFGARGDNADLGKRLLRGERLPRRPDRFERKLLLSAYQSLLFNRALALRLRAGTLARALPGDVMRKQETGGLFVCESPEVDQPRVDGFEISPAGPLFGPKMIRAQGEVAAGEAELLRAEGMELTDFERGGEETEGGRRPYRVPLAVGELREEGTDLWIGFELPRGSYATVVLRELLKQ
jgi:tRNA pseudouridine13 synthase